MRTPRYIEILLLLFSAFAFVSCANQPRDTSGTDLKLETLTRPTGQPATYVYRRQPADQ
jgi:hypothetical protein